MVTWNWEDMTDAQRMAITDNNEAPGRSTKQKRNEPFALGSQKPYKTGMVNIPGPLLVRIIRRYSGRSREYDGDNFTGGAKTLRDAIAAFLGLKGDSAQDGVSWEYEQERSEVTETVIKIFSKKSKKGLDE